MVRGKMTQKDRVLRHLRDYGTITSLEALSDYGIMRLGARIFELKDDGHEIRTIFIGGKNRYGEPTHYAKYVLNRLTEEKPEGRI